MHLFDFTNFGKYFIGLQPKATKVFHPLMNSIRSLIVKSWPKTNHEVPEIIYLQIACTNCLYKLHVQTARLNWPYELPPRTAPPNCQCKLPWQFPESGTLRSSSLWILCSEHAPCWLNLSLLSVPEPWTPIVTIDSFLNLWYALFWQSLYLFWAFFSLNPEPEPL